MPLLASKKTTHITKELERELLRQYQDEGSTEALEKLLNAHKPYVQHLAAKAYKQFNKVVEYEDLVQQASMGLLKAAKQFDLEMTVQDPKSPNYGQTLRFLTYAHKWIIAQMQDAWHHAHPVHIPAHTLRSIHFNMEATTPKADERKKLARLAMKAESYDALLDDAKSKENRSSSYNELSLQGTNVHDPTFEEGVKDVWSPAMQAIIGKLTPQEWTIFRMKMGLDTGFRYPMSEICKAVGLPLEQVDKLFKRAKRIVFKKAQENPSLFGKNEA